MQCSQCTERAVILNPPRCHRHFSEDVERRVQDFIAREGLLSPDDHVCVAASGGKDSLTLLHLLAPHYRVTALLIDEGIAGYREHSRQKLEEYCATKAIPLAIVSFADATGATLDELQQHYHPCSVCGTLRRHFLELHARRLGCTVIATGHNADDEAQTVLLNLVRAHTSHLLRGGPRTTGAVGFLPRVKPLFPLSEKEVMTYALLHQLTTDFVECPYASRGVRTTIRDALHRYERARPGARDRLLNNYLSLLKKIVSSPRQLTPCPRCGKPFSSSATPAAAARSTTHSPARTPPHERVCRACQYLEEIRGFDE